MPKQSVSVAFFSLMMSSLQNKISAAFNKRPAPAVIVVVSKDAMVQRHQNRRHAAQGINVIRAGVVIFGIGDDIIFLARYQPERNQGCDEEQETGRNGVHFILTLQAWQQTIIKSVAGGGARHRGENKNQIKATVAVAAVFVKRLLHKEKPSGARKEIS